MELIDGNKIATDIVAEMKAAVAALPARKPCIALVRVGEDPASVSYVKKKEQTAAEIGITSRVILPPAAISQAELFALIVRRCEEFLSLIRRGKCPDPDGSESALAAQRSRWAGHPGEQMRLSAGGWEHLQASRECREMIAALKGQQAYHDQQVMDEMGDATEVVSPLDTLACRWQPVTTRRLDQGALKLAHPELYGEYVRESTTRRFEANP